MALITKIKLYSFLGKSLNNNVCTCYITKSFTKTQKV